MPRWFSESPTRSFVQPGHRGKYELEAGTTWRRTIPSLLTVLRIVVLPGVVWMSLRGLRLAAIGLYAAILLSDVVDGRVARQLGAETRFGAYFDVLADTFVILGLLAMFSARGVIPVWLPAAPLVVAVIFLLTSRHRAPRYDPIGKHYGTVLYILVGVLLWGGGSGVLTAVWSLIVAPSAVVLASRWFSRRGASRR